MKWQFVDRGAFDVARKKAEWYGYKCSACGHYMRLDDIITRDAFPERCPNCDGYDEERR